ncbi:MAG TPA: hypothetical protein ENK32_08700 [Anaerolineae bacterium]|nr:hypothetical protein [Anaerolineae bacterium]
MSESINTVFFREKCKEDYISMYEFDTAVTAQTLRFNLMNTTGGNTGAVDIAVYGSFIDE